MEPNKGPNQSILSEMQNYFTKEVTWLMIMTVALNSTLTWFWQAADCLKIRSKLSPASAAMANKAANTWGRDACRIHPQHRQWKEEITRRGPNSAALAIMLSNAERTRVRALTDIYAQMDMWVPSEGFKCRYKHNSPGLAVSECQPGQSDTNRLSGRKPTAAPDLQAGSYGVKPRG